MLGNDGFKAGQRLKAASLAALVDEVRRLSKLTATSPLAVSDDPSGFNVSIDVRGGFWIRLTGGGAGGKYAWTRILAAPGGTWTNYAPETGTVAVDPAYEEALRTTVPIDGTARARAWRDEQTHEVRFQYGKC